jgi:hypothetical protein
VFRDRCAGSHNNVLIYVSTRNLQVVKSGNLEIVPTRQEQMKRLIWAAIELATRSEQKIFNKNNTSYAKNKPVGWMNYKRFWRKE